MDALENQLDDLGNRSRRNNVVFWGIPETSEGDSTDCRPLVQEFIEKHMGIEHCGGPIEIERAHRSPMGKLAKAQADQRGKPRPIHVKFLRYGDRDSVLRAAPKSLKDKLYQGSRVFITDDVSEKVRAERKKLISIRNKIRKEGNFAVVPWTVPACLLVKHVDGNLKSFTVNTIGKNVKVGVGGVSVRT